MMARRYVAKNYRINKNLQTSQALWHLYWEIDFTVSLTRVFKHFYILVTTCCDSNIFSIYEYHEIPFIPGKY